MESKTIDLVKDFFKNQLDQHGTTIQAQRIGKRIRGGKDKHVRATMRSTRDKNNIFSKRKFLRGPHIYLDDDLTITQQEERRKEWKKVKTARENGKWARLQNGKAQISDRITHNKQELGHTQEHLTIFSWNYRGYPWRRGPGLGPIAKKNDIIMLTETHEHDG